MRKIDLIERSMDDGYGVTHRGKLFSKIFPTEQEAIDFSKELDFPRGTELGIVLFNSGKPVDQKTVVHYRDGRTGIFEEITVDRDVRVGGYILEAGDRIEIIQEGRLEEAMMLNKAYRWEDGSISTLQQAIDNGMFKAKFVSIENGVKYNRIKYNRMDRREQEDYEARLNREKKVYNLVYARDESISADVNRKAYEYADLPVLPDKNFFQKF